MLNNLGAYNIIVFQPAFNGMYAGSLVTWILTSAGNLLGCGRNNYGQQGNGTSSSSDNVSTLTQRLTDVMSFSATSTNTWAIKNDNTLWGCGKNEYGQQGNGGTSNVTSFTQREDKAVQVACSDNTTWYIRQISNGNTMAYGCGLGFSGQQGDGSTSNSTYFSQRTDAFSGEDYTPKVICSNKTTWYIRADGTLWGCGANDSGQQGNQQINGLINNFTPRIFI